MGKQFDSLVDLVRKSIDDDEQTEEFGNVKNYLRNVLKRAAVFDFPIDADEIFPRSGKDMDDYMLYLADYFALSAQYDSFFLTPFPVTAVEDPTSVVIFDPIKDNKYFLISCRTQYSDGAKVSSLLVTHMVLDGIVKGDIMGFNTLIYGADTDDGKRIKSALDYDTKIQAEILQTDIRTAMLSYVEQIVYIMDPANFIIRAEHTPSVRQARKNQQKKRKRQKAMIPKTIMRPHYVVLSQEDTVDFLKGKSKTPQAARPVRGHWKKLISERFTKKRGQTIPVRQYFKGVGEVEAVGGWVYQVMLKEDPVTLVPYDAAA